MERNDILSAALDECGLDLNSAISSINPQQSSGQSTSNLPKPNITSADIKPFIVNNELYYKTPAGIVQLKDGKTISFVSQEELNQAMLTQKLNSLAKINSNLYVQNTLDGRNLIRLNVPQTISSVPNISNNLQNVLYLKQMQNLINLNTPRTSPNQFRQNQKKETDSSNLDQLEEDEEVFTADTYADYMPSKLKIGNHHPDQVVETSSLSSVFPPDIYYQLYIPEETIDEGRLSALQLEAVTYACQQHDTLLPDGTRAGFLIGDGAGVGKGRTIAGIIYENYLRERKKSIWLSVSNDLKYDAERDLLDIGAKKIPVYLLNKFKYGKISSKENGKVKKGIIFATYSSLISESHTKGGSYKTRLSQLLEWCGKDFDGVIVFDECHKAKNLCPNAGSNKSTKTGIKVLELQNKLPKARIIYASATGATEPRNMAYMVRLGLWGKGTSFPTFNDFISTVEKRGVGAMELVAIDMKLRGMYIARQLSFAGVQFQIEEIKLNKDFISIYDDCVALWVDAKSKFEKALELMEDENSIKKAVWTQFWAAHQRFFKYLCIASKVPYAVKLCKESLKDNKSVVIGLQSTGEAKTLEQLEESGGELTEFVSTAKAVFQSLIEKHFPAPNRKKTLKLLGLDSNFFGEKLEEKYNVRNSRRARLETEKKLRETSNKKNDWSDDSDESEESFNVKDDDVSDYTISDKSDEDEKFGEDEDTDYPTDDEIEDESENEGSEDFSDEEEPWDAYTRKELNKKRSKNKNSLQNKKIKKDERQLDFCSQDAGEICERMRDSLLDHLDKLSSRLPKNTIDELIEELGGSDSVAEMTGRKGRVISDDDGAIVYESRNENDVPLELLNMTEKDRFMNDEKQIAIISEAASSGISLHSDRRFKNKKRRVHITIELPWSADRAIQQFGRTHRSNQVNAPKYVFLISDLAGEQRFASIVAKRLESLGALTHGDRRATDTRDLSKFNIDNKYGRSSLEIVLKSIIDQNQPLVPPPSEYKGNFFHDCRQQMIGAGLVNFDENSQTYNLEKNSFQISTFLNRILGLTVAVQNAVFQYFTDTLESVIKQAKRLGRYDQGIMDLTSEMSKVERLEHRKFSSKHSTGTTTIELHKVAVERSMSWKQAIELFSLCNSSHEGFYLTESEHMIRKGILLAVSDKNKRDLKKNIYRIYKPNTGLQCKNETLDSLKERKGKKIDLDKAREFWEDIYNNSDNQCKHVLWFGGCKRLSAKLPCDIGLRKRIYYILSGSVLTVWSDIEKTVPHISHKLQIVRLNVKDDIRVIGILIPQSSVSQLVNLLEQNDKKQKEFSNNNNQKVPLSQEITLLSDSD